MICYGQLRNVNDMMVDGKQRSCEIFGVSLCLVIPLGGKDRMQTYQSQRRSTKGPVRSRYASQNLCRERYEIC